MVRTHRVGADFEGFELFPEGCVFILEMLIVVFELLIRLSELASGIFPVLIDTIENTFPGTSTAGGASTVTLVKR